jgi:plastocyanin
LKIANWRLGAIAAALLTVGAFAACGGGDDSTKGGDTTKPAASPTSAGKVEVPAGAPEIDQDNLTFKPDKLTVKAGDKVYFKNSETALHTVTIDGKNVSGNMKKGDVVVWTAATAKTYKITCDYHPQMNATITAQ